VREFNCANQGFVQPHKEVTPHIMTNHQSDSGLAIRRGSAQ
jgi:hypothetical protein